MPQQLKPQSRVKRVKLEVYQDQKLVFAETMEKREKDLKLEKFKVSTNLLSKEEYLKETPAKRAQLHRFYPDYYG